MSNVLFINLKRNGDIFNTAALAQSYVKENPHAMPYILVYDEFKKATKPLSVFKGVFTIDRKKITTFSNNDIYSNGFALAELLEELDFLNNTAWTDIINYSSDKTSTFLTNYLAAANQVNPRGIHFGESNQIKYESNWEIIFNDILTKNHLSPVHFSTAYHGMVNSTDHEGPYAIKTIKKHDSTVETNFDSLRNLHSKGDEPCQLIGIQLLTSLADKNWSFDTVKNLVSEVLESNNLHPLILIAPTQDEREYAAKLNSNFDDKLIVIESDFLALSSVLRGLDLLVTPDTSVKHLADLNNCKVLECSYNLKLSFKQGTRNSGNLILNLENREAHILEAIKFLLDPSEQTIEDILEADAYLTYRDKLGWDVKPLNGDFSAELFVRQLKRSYLAEWNNISHNWDVKKYFSDYNYSEVQSIIDKEKSFISEVSRDLLGTLRGLVKATESKTEAGSFITSLEKLLAHSESSHLGSVPVIEFKALLETLNQPNQDQQLRSAEDLLYKLKKNLQVALECLNNAEKDARSMPILKKEKRGSAQSTQQV